MVMVALPLPPLPLIVCKELEDEHSFVSSDLKAVSSHDLIAHMLNIACTVASSSINRARMERQACTQEQLFARVDAWQDASSGDVPDEEWCYNTAMEFTRMYIASYLPCPRKEADLRFLPAAEIDRSHRVHQKALEFQQAQDILYGACSTNCTRPLQDMTFAQLVQHSFRRMLEARENAQQANNLQLDLPERRPCTLETISPE